MATHRYTVVEETETWGEELCDTTTSEAKARKLAAELADRVPEARVYVRFFREVDGCHGFLNRFGHCPTGVAW